jgi:hypothetical protein
MPQAVPSDATPVITPGARPAGPPSLPAAAARRRWPVTLMLLTWLTVAACAEGGPPAPVDPIPTTPSAIATSDGDGQQGTVGSALPVRPTVVVRDAAGRGVAGVNVVFNVTAGGGWVAAASATTAADGTASTTWYMGPSAGTANRLQASAAGTLHAEFTATATALVPGSTYYGANAWVEMLAGDIPVIVSAPHGGTLRPASIPDRTGSVTTVRDANTEELARDIADAFRAKTGGTPHVIILRLHRIKLDANREIVEAAQGNAEAERAWHEFHGYIEAARAAVVA